jgi:hypothetical protein
MLRREALIAVGTGAAVIVVVAAASAERSSLWREIELPWAEDPVTIDRTQSTVTLAPPPFAELEPGDGADLGWLAPILLVLVVVAALAAAAGAVWWLGTRRWARSRRPEPPTFDVLPEVDLTEATDGLDDVLAQGSPRNAIVECWVRLEKAVQEAGLPPDPAETSEETATRVLKTYTVDHEAIGALAALYREARFSVHELDEHHRDLARDALAELRRELQAPVPSTAGAPP